MFPSSYFPPGYFTPDYWPKGASAVAGHGFRGIVNRRLAAMILEDMQREHSLIMLREQQKQQMIAMFQARQTEWNMEVANQKRIAEESMYTVLLTEI